MGILPTLKSSVASAEEYLAAANQSVAINIGDSTRVLIKSQIPTNIKEIVCNLLSGNGLLLPNLQICIMVNIEKLLGLDNLQAQLRDALNKLKESMTSFMDHLNIDKVLGRINSVISQASQIASMVNFCASPIQPIAIPNVLENLMQSFLGKGEELLNRIGNMIPETIGGCISTGGFNTGVFTGGILGTISQVYPQVVSGTVPDVTIGSIVSVVDTIVNDLDALIESENCVKTHEALGGSSFYESDQPVNMGVGVFHNPDSIGIQGNSRLAFSLKGAFSQLAGYAITDQAGKTYQNIFELILDDDMISLLRDNAQYPPEIQQRSPVFSYCGDIIGYTTETIQGEIDKSKGWVQGEENPPGWKADGLDTSGGNNPCYIAPDSGTLSDIRLKTHVMDSVESGAIIDDMQVKQFHFNGIDPVTYGFIAQDLYECFPEAVTVGDSDWSTDSIRVPWRVNMTSMVPLLVKETQTLRHRVADLEDERSSLKYTLDQVLVRLAALELRDEINVTLG